MRSKSLKTDMAVYVFLTVVLTLVFWCLWSGVGQAAEYTLVVRFESEQSAVNEENSEQSESGEQEAVQDQATGEAPAESESLPEAQEPNSDGDIDAMAANQQEPIASESDDEQPLESTEQNPEQNPTDQQNQVKVKEYLIDDTLVVGEQSFETEGPMVPLRLLADACEVPLAWRSTAYGGAALWCKAEPAVAIIPDKARLYYTTKPYAAYKTIYEKPLAADGSIWLPVSVLPALGLTYELDWQNRRLTVIVPELGQSQPDQVWQELGWMVKQYLKPPTKLLAAASTSFDPKNQNRSHNLLLAASSLHGKTIAAGQSFSFNQTVGQRTPARGYKKAIIFVNKQQVLDYGGGVCQVSTTLYQAVKKAGLKITERHSHSLPVSYAARGQDATVAWGSLDFRFVNSTAEPVYIISRYQAGTLTIEVWQGQKPAELPEVMQF